MTTMQGSMVAVFVLMLFGVIGYSLMLVVLITLCGLMVWRSRPK